VKLLSNIVEANINSKEEAMEENIMRVMAWERAKGELSSILVTFSDDHKYDRFNEVLQEFVRKIEDEGYIE